MITEFQYKILNTALNVVIIAVGFQLIFYDIPEQKRVCEICQKKLLCDVGALKGPVCERIGPNITIIPINMTDGNLQAS